MPKGKGPKHTACRRGTPVIIKFKDGRVESDVFVERKNGVMLFEKNGRVHKKEIVQFLIKKYQVVRNN